MDIKNKIAILLSKHVGLDNEKIVNLIEVPPVPELGDYAFPCFVIARQKRQQPFKIAEKLSKKIQKAQKKLQIKEIKRINPVGSYINFYINKKIFAEQTIGKILREKDKYGSGQIGKRGKALIEHTSINPNASPHVGRARNALIGDSITKILKFQGFNTEVHFYVNDVSKQIAMLVLVFTGKEKFSDLLRKYIAIVKKIEKQPEIEKQVFEILSKFEEGDQKIVNKFNRIVKIALNGQKKILSKLGIKYDYFDYESKYIKSEKIFKEFEKTGRIFTDSEDRIVLNQRGLGFDNKMRTPILVLTRSDGTGLYPLRDIIYTIEKLNKAEKNIIVLGEDQKLYFEQLKAALKLIGKRAPEVVHYSFVLIESKAGKDTKTKAAKMSTRRGEFVLLEDFMKQVRKKAEKEIKKRKTKGDAEKIANGAVKYAILKNDSNKNIIFNLEQAMSFEGETGPYLQYSYARASSILKKAKKFRKKIYKKSEQEAKPEFFGLEEKEIKLIKKLSQFPEIVQRAYRQLNPSVIANYSFQLAQTFNEFYHECPVIGSEDEDRRLVLVSAFRQVIKNSLGLLGIEVMEEM